MKFVISAHYVTRYGNIQHYTHIVEASNEFEAQTKGFALLSNDVKNHNEENSEDNIVQKPSKIQYKPVLDNN